MGTIGNINISIGLVGLTLCGIVILHIAAGPKMEARVMRQFIAMFACLAAHIACNLAGQVMRGVPGESIWFLLHVVNFGEFFFSVLLAYIVTRFLLQKLDLPGSQRKLYRLLNCFLGVHVLLLIINLFTGLCYIIDEGNVYHRSAGYPLAYLMPLLIILMAIFLLIRSGSQMTHKERIAFWLYFLIPLAGMFVQVFVYGIYIVIAGLVVSAVIMYIFILSDQQEQTYLQRQANEELKVEIMLSQIQPHFLYNCLAVIREICLNDGKQGAAAIDEFTEYLRHNMDSIQKTSPIPFEEELNHTKRYLQLQQLRFGQELNVAYDIRCTDFRIPSLTLQPLVENAVRYGVRKKEEGDGHVLITARECEDHYEISVTDDGPGFDPRMISEDGGQHVGLLNVRQRLQATVGGELVIDSVIGQGATVTMILPKEV